MVHPDFTGLLPLGTGKPAPIREWQSSGLPPGIPAAGGHKCAGFAPSPPPD